MCCFIQHQEHYLHELCIKKIIYCSQFDKQIGRNSQSQLNQLFIVALLMMITVLPSSSHLGYQIQAVIAFLG